MIHRYFLLVHFDLIFIGTFRCFGYLTYIIQRDKTMCRVRFDVFWKLVQKVSYIMAIFH